MNLVTVAMHNAGASAMAHCRPALVIAENGVVRLDYFPPDATAIYTAMEKERVRHLVPENLERGTLEFGDTQRLEWLAKSGRRLQRLGANWRVDPEVAGGKSLGRPWFPSMREAIDAEKRK